MWHTRQDIFARELSSIKYIVVGKLACMGNPSAKVTLPHLDIVRLIRVNT